MADASEKIQPTLPLPPDPPEESPPRTVAGSPSTTEVPQTLALPPAGTGAPGPTVDHVPAPPAAPPRADSADLPRTEALSSGGPAAPHPDHTALLADPNTD